VLVDPNTFSACQVAVEVLRGRPIADPYRWLEDPDSAETADWVKRQNEFTVSYLESLPDRPWFLDTMQ